MKKIALLATLSLAASFAFADIRSECEAKAIGANGKPLAGAARSAFMKKCMAEAAPGEHAACAAKAVDKNGKPLHGAARSAFMKKCVAEAGGAVK